MKVKELDVIILKDGREATVLEVFDKGEAYMVEITDAQEEMLDTPIITNDDIEKIIYKA